MDTSLIKDKDLCLGKKIKIFLVEHNISQTAIAKIMNYSDSVISDKLNGKVKLYADEFYLILQIINSLSEVKVCANDFMPITEKEEEV